MVVIPPTCDNVMPVPAAKFCLMFPTISPATVIVSLAASILTNGLTPPVL